MNFWQCLGLFVVFDLGVILGIAIMCCLFVGKCADREMTSHDGHTGTGEL